MEKLTLQNDTDPSSLVIGLDEDTKKGMLFARSDNSVTQFPRLEIDFEAFSVSLLNSSDLGLVVDNNGLTTIHQLIVEGAFTAGNGCFSIDGANNVNLTGNILMHGTDAQKILGEGDSAIGANFSNGQFICNIAGGEVANLSELTLSDGSQKSVLFGARQLANATGQTVFSWDQDQKVGVYLPLTIGPLLPHTSIPNVLNPDGSVSFANGKFTVGADGTIQGAKFQVNPDGSMQLGEALSIDQNGIMTQNGGNINVLATYDMVFESGGPVVTGDNGTTKYRFKVDIHGAPYAQVVA
jgi:hypothetical protein